MGSEQQQAQVWDCWVDWEQDVGRHAEAQQSGFRFIFHADSAQPFVGPQQKDRSTTSSSEVGQDALLGHALAGEQLGDGTRHVLLPAQHSSHAAPVGDAVVLDRGSG